jgi:hypothetical protein
MTKPATKKTREKQPTRPHRTVYTADDPELEAMIDQAQSDGWVFTRLCCNALKEHLTRLGFGKVKTS